jgi:hypothetical protein
VVMCVKVSELDAECLKPLIKLYGGCRTGVRRGDAWEEFFRKFVAEALIYSQNAERE